MVLRVFNQSRVFFSLSVLLFKRHVTLSLNKIFHERQYVKLMKEKLPLPLDHDLHIPHPTWAPGPPLWNPVDLWVQKANQWLGSSPWPTVELTWVPSESSYSYLFHMSHCTLSSGHTARSTPASPRHCQGHLSGLCTHT